jgi:cytochrome c
MREKLEAAVLICAIQQASAQDGKAVFARCAVCHSVEAGVNRLGPTLAGIHGRAAGAIENFVFSRTMSMSKIVWNDEALDAYLASQKKYVPGDRRSCPRLWCSWSGAEPLAKRAVTRRRSERAA